LTIQLNSKETESVDIQLINMVGQTVRYHKIYLNTGFAQLPFDIQNLPKGVYQLHIKQGNKTEIKRVSLQ
jgi:hypothetical protein